MIKRIIVWLMIGMYICLNMAGCALHYPDNGLHYQGAKTLSSAALVTFPIAENDRKLYLKVQGSVDQTTLSTLRQIIDKMLRDKGYQLSDNQYEVNYILKVDVLYIGPGTQDAAQDVLLQGYHGATWPAGAIAVGKKLYVTTAPPSNFAYMMVADVDVIEAGAKRSENVYQTRLVSEYPNGLKFEKFESATPALIQGIARFISAVF